MRAYGPKWRLSSVNGAKPEMKASMGMTNAAVLPEPVGLRQREWSAAPRDGYTCFGDANNITVLQSDRDRLPLDRRRLLVANRFDTIQDGLRNGRLGP